MSTPNTPKPIYIAARRWFDGANTYHSVCVTYDDGSQRIAPYVYGYGDHFFHTAGVLMGRAAESAAPDTAYEINARWCSENRVGYEVADVRRRKYLHDGGRLPRAPRVGRKA